MKNSVILITGGTGSFGRAFVNYVLKKNNPKKILANSEKDNFASIKALKKNGFKVKNFKVVKRKLKKKLIYFYIDKKTWLMNQDKYKIFGVRNLGVSK